MRDSASITAVGHASPSRFISVADALESAGYARGSARVYERFFGQQTVAQVDRESLLDQIEQAARECLYETGTTRVTHILYAHTINHAFPSDPLLLYKLRRRLGCDGAKVIHLSQLNCTTGIYAIELARQIVAKDLSARVLVVCGELAQPTRAKVISNVIVMGEAVACCLIEAAQGPYIGTSSFDVDGSFHKGEDMETERRKLYDKAYIGHMASNISKTLRRAHIEVDGVDSIFPHNVNRLSWNGVLSSVGLVQSTLRDSTLATYGHCFTADPLINMHRWLSEKSKLPPVSLMCSSGLGATFGSLVVYGG